VDNYYKDNDDLRWYVDKGIDWAPIVELTEYLYRSKEGHSNLDEALDFYKEVFELVGNFTAQEIGAHSEAIDREGVSLVDGEGLLGPTQRKIFKKIRQLELHGMPIPRELGGMNCPMLVYYLNTEMFARADSSVAAHHGFHAGIAMAMLMYSIQEGTTHFDVETASITSTRFQKEIEEIRSGKAWGCMDITEPNAGSDMAALRCRGEQDEQGNWFVTGTKIYITSGHGKYHFVIARTEESSDPDDPFAGLGGLSMFLVPAYTGSGPHRKRTVEIVRLEEKLGHHGSATAALSFERAPAQLVGNRGDGFKYMLLLMNNARIAVGFECLGLCTAALEGARAYALERRSMGKTIDRHEMIADYLDEMENDIQAIRALVVKAAWHEELSQKITVMDKAGITAASDPAIRDRVAGYQANLAHHKRMARRYTPLLKYVAAEKSVEISRRALQIHGGAGFTKDYGAEKLLRDSIVMPIYEGTSQIQSLMAMKDTLGGILKNPQAFVRRSAQCRWKIVAARDPLDRRVAKLQRLSLSAQQYLMTRTVTDKYRSLQGKPISEWPDRFMKDWNPKRDFAFAMLHAERLTQILCDEAIAELLLEQAREDTNRRPILEKFLERAEPRCRHMYDILTTTGDRLLNELHAQTDVTHETTAVG
jgi:hypothetical protein